MSRVKAQKNKISLNIDSGLWNRFKEYCEGNAFNLSGKVELLLKKELANAKRKETSHKKVLDAISKFMRGNETASKVSTATATVRTAVPARKVRSDITQANLDLLHSRMKEMRKSKGLA
ncbi:hypothetical protein JW868_01820 [Candidatus Woesearchaeota archaeon]|nr:hypothetical protein [Candidatus Woesearchaeota archaeon]